VRAGAAPAPRPRRAAHLRARRDQVAREVAGAGPDLQHHVARGHARGRHDAAQYGLVGQEVLAERPGGGGIRMGGQAVGATRRERRRRRRRRPTAGRARRRAAAGGALARRRAGAGLAMRAPSRARAAAGKAPPTERSGGSGGAARAAARAHFFALMLACFRLARVAPALLPVPPPVCHIQPTSGTSGGPASRSDARLRVASVRAEPGSSSGRRASSWRLRSMLPVWSRLFRARLAGGRSTRRADLGLKVEGKGCFESCPLGSYRADVPTSHGAGRGACVPPPAPPVPPPVSAAAGECRPACAPRSGVPG
jgi:hypothetical protein